jgi:predicted Zn-dependent protease
MKLFAVVAAFATALSLAPPAGACLSEVELEMERFNASPAGQVAVAEKELESGKAAAAAARVRASFPNIRALGADAAPLALRAERIYALAVVRTDGTLDDKAGWARWGNMEWALQTLGDLDRAKPNNPAVQADLAEAEVALERTRKVGIETLESLDRRDLLGSSYAYLALARAREATGDHDGMLAAARRCAAMSTNRRQCQIKI